MSSLPAGLYLLPLAFAVALVSPALLAPVSREADLLLSRLALPIFGTYVAASPRKSRQERRLRAAALGTTHRVYAARTLLLAGLFGVAGGVLGVYLAAGALALLGIGADGLAALLPAPLSFLGGVARLSTLSIGQLFAVLLFSSATLGTTLALGTYWARWRYLDQKAEARARAIDATLPRTVAFLYALSRSGMTFPKVLETLVRNREAYGEAAEELGIAVRDMDAFGTDMLTALQRTGDRTPSDGLEEFAENLASVLGGGRNLSTFLRNQYERQREEAESKQRQYLDLLSTLAEAYVTVFVAGPLFFVTVLVVIGLVIQDTLPITRLVAYAGIPLASLAFVAYVDSLTSTLQVGDGERVRRDVQTTFASALDADRSGGGNGEPDATAASPGEGIADGGPLGATGSPPDRWQSERERLAAHDRLAGVRRWAADPFGAIVERPAASLLVTLPIALGLLWLRTAGVRTLPADPGVAVAAVDEVLLEAAIVVGGGYAIAHEVRTRRGRTIDDAMPNLLDRLASVNEAGATVIESVRRVRGSDLGALTPEVDRTWRDIRWGADAETALRRFESRAGTVPVRRAVTLIVNAMHASGDLAPVLRIAAEEARETRRLREERLQEMFTYLLVVYVAFLVFLGIVVAMNLAFIPAVENATAGGGAGVDAAGGVAGGVLDVNDVDTDAYRILFFHIAAIQALFSGLIAGQLGEGRVADGAKHATAMMIVAYLVFALI